MGTKTIISCDSCGKSREGFDSGARDFYSFGISINPYPLLQVMGAWRGSCLLCRACVEKLPVFAGYDTDERDRSHEPSAVIDSLEGTSSYAGQFRKTDYI